MTEDGDQNDRGSGDTERNEKGGGDSASLPLAPRVEPLQADIYERNADNPGQQIANEVKRVIRWGGMIAVATMIATVVQAFTSFYQLCNA